MLWNVGDFRYVGRHERTPATSHWHPQPEDRLAVVPPVADDLQRRFRIHSGIWRPRQQPKRKLVENASYSMRQNLFKSPGTCLQGFYAAIHSYHDWRYAAGLFDTDCTDISIVCFHIVKNTFLTNNTVYFANFSGVATTSKKG